MTEILIQIYMALVPIGLGIVVAMVKKILKQTREEQKANKEGTMLLLRVALIELHDKYTNEDSIPSYAYDNYCDIHASYKILGGNGMADKMKSEVDKIPIRKKRGCT